MKAKRRHELHTNLLSHWMGRKLEAVRPYFSWIGIGLAVVVLLWVGIYYLHGRSEAQLDDAWNKLQMNTYTARAAVQGNDDLQFQDAVRSMEEVISESPDTALSLFGNVWLGDVYLERGRALINVNRTAALDNFKRAVQSYGSAVEASASDLIVKSRVLFTKGEAQEWMFQLDEARASYKQVDGLYKPEAQQRLNSLGTKTTADLYALLQKTMPKPPSLPPSKVNENFGSPDDNLQDKLNAELKNFILDPNKLPSGGKNGSKETGSANKDGATKDGANKDGAAKTPADKPNTEKATPEKTSPEKASPEKPGPEKPAEGKAAPEKPAAEATSKNPAEADAKTPAKPADSDKK